VIPCLSFKNTKTHVYGNQQTNWPGENKQEVHSDKLNLFFSTNGMKFFSTGFSA
jgi:hypothetical protein